MRVTRGDLFQIPCDAFCITTNGFVKQNGECVMGRGCAKQAATYWPALPRHLGELIKRNGNNVTPLYLVGTSAKVMLSFPVKPEFIIYDGENCVKHMAFRFKVGDRVPGWAAKAQLNIIKRSAEQLKKISDVYGWRTIVIPRTGCGAGELSWEDQVRPCLDGILDDRFLATTN